MISTHLTLESVGFSIGRPGHDAARKRSKDRTKKRKQLTLLFEEGIMEVATPLSEEELREWDERGKEKWYSILFFCFDMIID